MRLRLPASHHLGIVMALVEIWSRDSWRLLILSVDWAILSTRNDQVIVISWFNTLGHYSSAEDVPTKDSFVID